MRRRLLTNLESKPDNNYLPIANEELLTEYSNIRRSLESCFVLEEIKQDILANGLTDVNNKQLELVCSVALAGTGIATESAFPYLNKDQNTIVAGINKHKKQSIILALEFFDKLKESYKKSQNENFKHKDPAFKIAAIRKKLDKIKESTVELKCNVKPVFLDKNLKPFTNFDNFSKLVIKFCNNYQKLLTDVMNFHFNWNDLSSILNKDLIHKEQAETFDKYHKKLCELTDIVVKDMELTKTFDDSNKRVFELKDSYPNGIRIVLKTLPEKPFKFNSYTNDSVVARIQKAIDYELKSYHYTTKLKTGINEISFGKVSIDKIEHLLKELEKIAENRDKTLNNKIESFYSSKDKEAKAYKEEAEYEKWDPEYSELMLYSKDAINFTNENAVIFHLLIQFLIFDIVQYRYKQDIYGFVEPVLNALNEML